ncbi:MAG: YihY/virulence factor BrkB family protein [Chloroflexota bacterium]
MDTTTASGSERPRHGEPADRRPARDELPAPRARSAAPAEPTDHGAADVTRTEAETRAGLLGRAKNYGVLLFNKFNNDTTMNLVAMVAFNVLTSTVPLILALITAIALLPVVSNNVPALAAQINSILPADLAKDANIAHLLTSIHSAGTLLTVVSIVGLLWGGMNLFSSIETAFAFIFRVKTRDLVWQKLMSLVMILLFAGLLPLSFLASIVLGAGTTALGRILPNSLSGPFTAALGLAASLGSLFVLFLAIYIVVPNRPIAWRHAWHGALFAAMAMAVVNTAFPVYTAHFVGTREYSTAAIATAIITITWFWFFSLVLLLGAQINAIGMGHGPWKYDITRVLMEHSADEESMPPRIVKRRRHRSLFFSGIARDSHKVQASRSHSEPEHDSGA